MKYLAFAPLVVASLAGCAKSVDGGTDSTAPPPNNSFVVDSGAGFVEPDVDCAEETKQIYVLGSDKALYRFDPPSLTFTRIGAVGCASTAGTFSMAINRRGTAYVEFTDGNLFAVDTRTAACKPTSFQSGQTGFQTFGMGYALNGGTSKTETLYVAGAGLAALDTTTFQFDFKGSLALGSSELTGQGTQLFAFSVGSGVVAELDKSNGSTLKSYRTSAIEVSAAFAFAQWGGDFYIFTGTNSSVVTRYSPTTDTSVVVVPNAGILIVGAGSSTCAPSTPPR